MLEERLNAIVADAERKLDDLGKQDFFKGFHYEFKLYYLRYRWWKKYKPTDFYEMVAEDNKGNLVYTQRQLERVLREYNISWVIEQSYGRIIIWVKDINPILELDTCEELAYLLYSVTPVSFTILVKPYHKSPYHIR